MLMHGRSFKLRNLSQPNPTHLTTSSTVLCMPIFGAKKLDGGEPDTIGVIQLINKVDDADDDVFNEYDEEIMQSFLTMAGPIIE